MALPVRAGRLGYRLAYRALQVQWFVRRPRVQGVKCLITHGDRVLLVRHSYGSRLWDLPGGKMRRHEPPIDAARREMQEELGLGDAAWRAAGLIRGREAFRHDTIHCFTAELDAPDVHPDPIELEEIRWFDRQRLPAPLARTVRPVLDGIVPTPTRSSPEAWT